VNIGIGIGTADLIAEVIVYLQYRHKYNPACYPRIPIEVIPGICISVVFDTPFYLPHNPCLLNILSYMLNRIEWAGMWYSGIERTVPCILCGR